MKTIKNQLKLKVFSSLLSSSPLLPANKGCYTQKKVKGFLLLLKRLWSVWHTNGPQITSLQTRLGPSAWSARTCNAPSPWELLTLLPFPFVFPLSLLLLPLPPILTPLPLPFAVLKHLSADVFWALEHPGALRSRQREKIKNLYSAHGAGAISLYHWGETPKHHQTSGQRDEIRRLFEIVVHIITLSANGGVGSSRRNGCGRSERIYPNGWTERWGKTANKNATLYKLLAPKWKSCSF